MFIASDGNPMFGKFRQRFAKKYGMKIIQYERPADQSEGEAAHVDLYILSQAKDAIVNCPSTFSAFAKRQRDNLEKITNFWGIDSDKTGDHSEL